MGVERFARRAVAGCVLALILLVGQSASASPSKLSGNFAFLSGTGALFVMRADGTHVTPLGGLSPGSRLSISPDGRQIAFGQGGVLEGLQVVNLDGTGYRAIPNTNSNDREPDWSQDGSKLAFTHYTGSSYDIETINLDGTGRSDLTRGTPQFTQEPDWSPDGTRIAFWGGVNGYHIYTIKVDGTEFTNLTNDTTFNVRPAWSPDGRTIAFNHSPDQSAWDVDVMDADGTNPRKLTEGNWPVWSPDGQKIGFATGAGTTSGLQLYVVNAADGTGLQPVNSSPLPMEATWPAWGCKSPCKRK